MEKFEYKVIVSTLNDAISLEKHLNVMGMNGWELINIQDVKVTQLLIFKRNLFLSLLYHLVVCSQDDLRLCGNIYL